MIPLLQSGLPPSNLPFLIAAFVITGLAFIAYVFFIFRRRQEAQAEIERLLGANEEIESAGREVP